MSKPRKKPLPPLPIDIEPIGKKIKEYRKLRGKTQAKLSDIIGISRTALDSYESGRNHLNDEMLIRFALALKVSIDDLVGIQSSKQTEKFSAPSVPLC